MSWFSKWTHKVWTGYSDEDLNYTEAKLIYKWGAVDPREVKIKDTPVSSKPDDTIHSISITSQASPPQQQCMGQGKVPFILIPGFGGSGAMYYKMMKRLSQDYDLHVVDMRGMGGSGRPEFPAKSRAEAELYLLEGLECWRKANGIKKFVLGGHSLGGYVAAKYARQNPDKVMALVLLSPAGLWPAPADSEKIFRQFLQSIGCIKRHLFNKAKKYWAPGQSPLALLRTFGPLSSLMLKNYVNWYPSLGAEEKLDFKAYLQQVLMKPGTGELAMPYLLLPGAYGADPLITTMNQLKVPTTVLFGSRDWMADRNPPGVIFAENPSIKQRTIKDASHQLFLDQPKDVLETVLADLNGFLGANKRPSLEDRIKGSLPPDLQLIQLLSQSLQFF